MNDNTNVEAEMERIGQSYFNALVTCCEPLNLEERLHVIRIVMGSVIALMTGLAGESMTAGFLERMAKNLRNDASKNLN